MNIHAHASVFKMHFTFLVLKEEQQGRTEVKMLLQVKVFKWFSKEVVLVYDPSRRMDKSQSFHTIKPPVFPTLAASVAMSNSEKHVLQNQRDLILRPLGLFLSEYLVTSKLYLLSCSYPYPLFGVASEVLSSYKVGVGNGSGCLCGKCVQMTNECDTRNITASS